MLTGLLTGFLAIALFMKGMRADYQWEDWMGISGGKPSVTDLMENWGKVDPWGFLFLIASTAALGQISIGLIRIIEDLIHWVIARRRTGAERAR